jgi:hypothetical protein
VKVDDVTFAGMSMETGGWTSALFETKKKVTENGSGGDIVTVPVISEPPIEGSGATLRVIVLIMSGGGFLVWPSAAVMLKSKRIRIRTIAVFMVSGSPRKPCFI